MNKLPDVPQGIFEGRIVKPGVIEVTTRLASVRLPGQVRYITYDYPDFAEGHKVTFEFSTSFSSLIATHLQQAE